MIYPSAADILRCVDQTLADSSDPGVPQPAVHSALATVRHLVRHVELRLRTEAALLRDDLRATRALLEHLASYLAGDQAEAPATPAALRAALAQVLSPTGGEAADAFDDLEALAEQARRQREQVYQVLKTLQAFDAAAQATPGYRTARQQIREYLAYELRQEATLVQPAFAGRGPRR